MNGMGVFDRVVSCRLLSLRWLSPVKIPILGYLLESTVILSTEVSFY